MADYEQLRLVNSARHKTQSRYVREELGMNVRTYSNGENAFKMFTNAIEEDALYLLDEPIGGVDPATRDYILSTIISNYNPDASVVISTHLISDVEKVLDEVVFIDKGHLVLQSSVDQIREEKGMSVDALFREEFKC